MKSLSLSGRKAQLAFGAAFVTLLIVAIVSYRGISVSRESDLLVRHSHEVLENLKTLLFANSTIESNSRGYVLSGADSFLEAYTSGIASTRETQEVLRNLTADHPQQVARIGAIDRLITERIAFADEVIALGRAGDFVAAASAIRGGRGQQITNDFQAVVHAMEEEEERLLVLRDAEVARQVSQATTVLILGTLVGLSITAAAAISVQRDSARRGQAEDALRDNEERDLTGANESGAKYRGLLEAAPDAMVVVNQAGEIVLLNVQAEKRFGYHRDELLGQQVTNIIPEGFAERLIADDLRSAEDALAQQIGTGIELTGRRKDGSDFPIELMLSPLESAEGLLVTAAIRDISVRRAAEQHLIQMEGRYRGLLEAAPDAMVVVNQAGEIVLLNVQAEKQFGYPRDELLGQVVTNIIPEGFAERLIADDLRSAEDALAQQIGTGIELTARRKDGTRLPHRADAVARSTAPRASWSRPPSATSASGMQPTSTWPRRRAAIAACSRRPRTRWSSSTRPARSSCSTSRPRSSSVIRATSCSARRSPTSSRRASPSASSPTTSAPPRTPWPSRSAPASSSPARRKDGSAFPIELMLSPLESPEGILVTAAIRDISVRKAAEADLEQKVDHLNRSNEELGQFAYIASHDLQEPLRMVASYTQLLSRRYKGQLDADADEFIAFAVDGATRMQQLIQDLLTYSRVGSRGEELLATSSENALGHALTNLRGAIEDSGALVTHDPLPTVMADEMQLTQLFQNLVGNAIKYQNPGTPEVHVTADRNSGRKWAFSVSDNGMGIESEYFDRIFGMFQRLHGREDFAGTGIGLAVCKKIVERHGGTISVESEPGQGSTFRFALAGGGLDA